ncbi:MAG: type II secretion system F family protein [archaeon]|nr:type II secretion system F family protein [archaeon]
MGLKLQHWIGLILALVTLGISLIYIKSEIFFILIGVAIIVGSTPFITSLIGESKIAGQKEQMFLEFARNLVESVKTGTPISKSIVNVKTKSYGVLSPHVNKLANQISLGIPLGRALETFAKDVNNVTVSRAITLIGEAEKAGGNIGQILEAVAGAVNTADKLKKERKSSISTLVVQGYLIFFIFLAIIIVMEFKILPLISGIANIETIGLLSSGGGTQGEVINFSSAFLYLLLVQGFFSGLTIGLLSEGNIKAGIKHSFALMLSAFLVSSIASLLMPATAAAV